MAHPWFLEVPDWRQIVRENDIRGVNFLLMTDETWLPNCLVDTGFFPSGSQLKKNRPDLFRDLVPGECFNFGGWCSITVERVSVR